MQKAAAEKSKAEKEKAYGRAIHTKIRPLDKFYRAEDYHQKYRLRQNSRLMREFKAMYPSAEDFADSSAAMRINAFMGGSGSEALFAEEIDSYGLSKEGIAELERITHFSKGSDRDSCY